MLPSRRAATFGVSPGATDRLLDACEAADLPLLAGTSTASDVMRLLERGYTVAKFFPAEANGGAPALKAIGAPLPQMKFCPTGGVSLKNANDYLSLSNTLCVGGSWVAPADLVEKGDWKAIEETGPRGGCPAPLRLTTSSRPAAHLGDVAFARRLSRTAARGCQGAPAVDGSVAGGQAASLHRRNPAFPTLML